MVFAQAFLTGFFVLQYISMYCYFFATQYDNKSAEEWVIIYFVLSLTNDLYYVINIRSFYLSTLTSRLFRKTFIMALFKLFPRHFYRRWIARRQIIPIPPGTLNRREEQV
jgi:hypothetical protein